MHPAQYRVQWSSQLMRYERQKEVAVVAFLLCASQLSLNSRHVLFCNLSGAQQDLNRVYKRVRIQRFNQISICTRFECELFHRFFDIKSGCLNDGCGPGFGSRLQPSADIKACDIGKIHIKNDGMWSI